MFKDYDKYLSKSIEVYLFVLMIVFILKLVGLDYFALAVDNPIMIKIDKIFSNLILQNVLYFILLISFQYLMLSSVCKDNSKNFKIMTVISMPFTYLLQMTKTKIISHDVITMILELLYLYLIVFIYNYRYKKMSTKKLTIRFFIIILLNYLFQVLSVLTRYRYSIRYINDFIPNTILNLDYLLLLLIMQNLTVNREGAVNLCYQAEVGSFSLKKINLKKSLTKLRKRFQSNLKKFKSKEKVEKLSIIIYLVLSLIWNVFTVVLILIVAKINDTFIECLFILTSFWLSKGKFGKPFHFNSMALCFVVSNLTYYFLDRITTPLGISIFIPILLGVGLSYVTSKFVKKTYKPLYRGMPIDLFEETITKVVDKGSTKYKVCYDFYIENKSDLSLSFQYNYSVSGIRKIKDRINEKIKGLE